ncbi:hypothetical protein [Magnetococcus sp. PR-3]|uniref:hypothetical protein n=1 Tax=Magnetococcus sp. PR-3 TaxID=3120355 RepID=UPI002FCE5662
MSAREDVITLTGPQSGTRYYALVHGRYPGGYKRVILEPGQVAGCPQDVVVKSYQSLATLDRYRPAQTADEP